MNVIVVGPGPRETSLAHAICELQTRHIDRSGPIIVVVDDTGTGTIGDDFTGLDTLLEDAGLDDMLRNTFKRVHIESGGYKHPDIDWEAVKASLMKAESRPYSYPLDSGEPNYCDGAHPCLREVHNAVARNKFRSYHVEQNRFRRYDRRQPCWRAGRWKSLT